MIICVLLGGCSRNEAEKQKSEAAPKPKERVYDGAWWLSVDAGRRQEFVEGWVSCDNPPGEVKYRLSRYTFEQKMTAHYQNKPAERTRLVSAVLGEINAANANVPLPQGGEPNSYFNDGEYWRITQPSGRLGWVEGYIECEKRNSGSQNWSEKPETYVAEISSFYELNVKEETINLAKEKVLMKDVLLKAARK